MESTEVRKYKRKKDIEKQCLIKYQINVNQVEIIEESDSYTLVKCFVENNNNKKNLLCMTINEIYDNIQDEQQKKYYLKLQKNIYGNFK